MNNKEEEIKSDLLKQFDFLKDKIVVKRARRISCQVPQERFIEVLGYLANELKFSILCAITGLDEGETFGFIYHISRQGGEVIDLKINVPREKLIIETVTGYFASAEIYERELEDLLGAKVEGLREGRHYPLPENWPKGQYPLRKDWKASSENIKEPKNE